MAEAFFPSNADDIYFIYEGLPAKSTLDEYNRFVMDAVQINLSELDDLVEGTPEIPKYSRETVSDFNNDNPMYN